MGVVDFNLPTLRFETSISFGLMNLKSILKSFSLTQDKSFTDCQLQKWIFVLGVIKKKNLNSYNLFYCRLDLAVPDLNCKCRVAYAMQDFLGISFPMHRVELN